MGGLTTSNYFPSQLNTGQPHIRLWVTQSLLPSPHSPQLPSFHFTMKLQPHCRPSYSCIVFLHLLFLVPQDLVPVCQVALIQMSALYQHLLGQHLPTHHWFHSFRASIAIWNQIINLCVHYLSYPKWNVILWKRDFAFLITVLFLILTRVLRL